MAGRDDETTSFDPRTWAEGTPAPVPARPSPSLDKTPQDLADHDATSFDPRAWSTAAGEDPPPPPPPTDPSDIDAAPTASRRALLAGGAIAVVAAIGGLFVMRGGPPAAASGTTPPATSPTAPVVANVDRKVGRRTLAIAGPNDILATLAAAGISEAEAATAAKAAKTSLGNAAGELRLEFDMVTIGATTRMTRLVATRDDGSGVSLTAKPDANYAVEKLQAKLTTQVKVVRGEMDADSFYSAAVAAGVTDSLIDGFANAFSFDFDFQQEVAPGDIFEAAFEQKYNPSGQPVGAPRLIYVSLTTQAKSRSLYSFLAPGETEAGWYDGNGRSTVRSLMRTPVDGARISSKFGYRTHPILGYQKLHKGTDFAAPIGTPMYAAGDATVEVAAPRGAAGNFVILRHDNGWQTRYMHLNRFAAGLTPGARWKQGQQIGEVGTTGRSTGPHLHYEIWIEGEPIDPQSIDTGTGIALDGAVLTGFRKERDRIDKARVAQAS